jgi:F-type H+-transporting ATPase subunit delta
MSELETAARPYSKAIFELANDSDSLSLWSDVLQLAGAVAEDDAMHSAMQAPGILATQLADLFIDVMKAVPGAPEISKEAENLIRLLANNDRLSVLPAIAAGFEYLKKQAEGTVEVLVTTARKLSAKQQKQMAENLQKRLGKEVSITAEIDKSLIAGAIIKAGDLVIDGSARGRLNKLTSVLNK